MYVMMIILTHENTARCEAWVNGPPVTHFQRAWGLVAEKRHNCCLLLLIFSGNFYHALINRSNLSAYSSCKHLAHSASETDMVVKTSSNDNSLNR
jgi:hypothetical protein